MIAFLRGKLVSKEAGTVILDVNGVGYALRVSLPTLGLLQAGEVYQLHTYLQVREDAHVLYGFWDIEEKKFFLELIEISGIGANTALLMLSSLSAAELKDAIVGENLKVVQSIKGIGTKTAQRVILELKDKLKRAGWEAGATAASSSAGSTALLSDKTRHQRARQEAITALAALGVPKPTAEKNIETVVKQHGNELSVEELIKYALRS